MARAAIIALPIVVVVSRASVCNLVSPRSRAVVTILGFVVLAAVTSLLVGALGGDGSGREWLLSCAGALELWGVLLVASPELAHYLGVCGQLSSLCRSERRDSSAGAVSSQTASCKGSQRVTVYKARRGPDLKIGTVMSTSTGGYRLARRNPARGTYYTSVVRQTLPGIGVCVAAESPNFKVG